MKDLESVVATSQKTEERLRLVIDSFPAAMIMVNVSGDISHINRAAETLFGYPPGDMVGKSIDTLVPDAKQVDHSILRKTFFKNPSARPMNGRELLARKKNGDVFPVEVGLNSIVTTEGIIALCSVVDLTDRKKFEESILNRTEMLEETNELLYREATTDSLTNIANRRSLYSQLDTFLLLSRRNGQPVSILIADIDNFKKYNDTFGHPAGDRALKLVAQKLSETNRNADFVARYGGEEFAVLLPDTDQSGALKAAEKLRKSIEDISEFEQKITMSFGAATVIAKGDELLVLEQFRDNFIKQADEAMYHSKGNGRNWVTHFNTMV